MCEKTAEYFAVFRFDSRCAAKVSPEKGRAVQIDLLHNGSETGPILTQSRRSVKDIKMDMEGMADLVQQAEQLNAEIAGMGELPRVERNITQLSQEAQRLSARTLQIGQDTTDVKAAILLGSRGFDIPKISEKLESLSAAKTFEPLEPVRDTDIQGFLRNERENALLAVIEQTKKHTFEEAEERHWESRENEWEQEKQKILNALIGSGGEMVFALETGTTMNDSVSMRGRSTMDNIEMAYSRQVYVYNDKVIRGGVKPKLVDLFMEVAKKLDDRNVQELWNMVSYMTEIQVSASKSPEDARKSSKTQAAIVNQAKQYLEEGYKKYIINTIHGNLHQAQLGGIPGTYPLVRSFLNVKLNPFPGLEDGNVDGHPVWALVYYCMRCGDLQAALDVVNKALQHLGEFPTFLREYATNGDRRLSHNNETKVRLQYRRSVRNSTDPYKKAVYCLIGCCDPKEDHTEIADKTDDYLWLKLCQLTNDSQDNDNTDALSLTGLQSMLLEQYGETHFNAYQQPYLYFQVLWLTGQFEAACEFLSRIDKLRCHAVHAALVLYELSLLLLPNNIQAQLLSKEASDTGPLRRLNFACLIMMYTRKFEATDPREALQYFYFLRELETPQKENLFMSCVSEVVMETREFDMLLGQLGRDGSRKPGAIDKFHSDTQKIIDLVAKDTENKGLFEEAVKIYDLAQNHEKVLELMNKLLAQVLSQAPSPQSSKDRIHNMAVSIAERYRTLGHEGSRATTSTFYLLLDLATFFNLYHNKQTEEAYNVIQNLHLLPFSSESVDQKVKNFQNYTDEIRRSLPDILLATMEILFTLYKTTKSTSGQSPMVGRTGLRRDDGGKDTYIGYLRSQARTLITFAGMIPYRMPGDTNARLVQMEVLMN